MRTPDRNRSYSEVTQGNNLNPSQSQNQGNGSGLSFRGQSSDQNNQIPHGFMNNQIPRGAMSQEQHLRQLREEVNKKEAESYQQHLIRMAQMAASFGNQAERQAGQ